MRLLTSSSSSSFLFLLLYSIVVDRPTSVECFAAWLVERESACWTDLSVEDAIMGSSVVAASNSRFPEIGLRVESFTDEDRYASTNDDESAVLVVEKGDVLRVKLRNVPDVLRSELQYVAEVGGVAGGGGDGATAAAARFTSDTAGCGGRRAFGRVADELVLRLNDDEDVNDDVKVWAGWASGHEAVTLTPTVTLRRSERKVEDPAAAAAVAVSAEKEEESRGGEAKRTIPEGFSKDDDDETERRKAVAAERMESMRKQLPHHGHHDRAEIYESQLGIPPLTVKDKQKLTDRSSSTAKMVDAERRKDVADNDDEFGRLSSFSLESFFHGCLLMVAFAGSVLLTSGLVLKRKKGRRNL